MHRVRLRLAWQLIGLIFTLFALFGAIALSAPSASAAPRVGRVWFAIDELGRYEINEISSGSQFYTFYEYFDASSATSFRHYALINGSTDRVVVDNPSINGPFQASQPNGWMRKNDYVTYQTGGGIYTVVIEIDGREVARKSMPIE
jgi:hypothetical protein